MLLLPLALHPCLQAIISLLAAAAYLEAQCNQKLQIYLRRMITTSEDLGVITPNPKPNFNRLILGVSVLRQKEPAEKLGLLEGLASLLGFSF